MSPEMDWQKEILWDAPSRYGSVGRAARRVLQRALRPALVRQGVIDEAMRVRLERHDEQIQQLQLDVHGSPDRNVASADLGDLLYRVDVLERRHELAEASALVAGFSLPKDGQRAWVVQQAWSRDEQRRVLCSGATGSFTSLLEVSAPALESYARQHRWDLVLSREDLAAGRPAPWGKLPLVRSLLVDYDVVAWIDADAIIVDSDCDLADELEPDKDLYLVEHWGGEPYEQRANSGVFMVRAGEWANRLLDEIWRREDLSHHQWWENAALMQLLGYDIEASPVQRDNANPWLQRVKFLDLAWNSIPHWSRSRRPRINHYAALPLPRRRLLMLDDLTASMVRRGPTDYAFPVGGRDDLPRLFNRLGFIGVGVEVGARNGSYSAWILHRWAGNQLISVDPWTASPGDDHGDAADIAQRRHNDLHIQTVHRLMPFGERSAIWRMTSAEAVSQVADASLDFVYIDARHEEAAISEDRTLWEPKIRPGGVLAGRDYVEEHL
jgi:Methyltransferase domain/galactosyl transferase GMA12/MNN10 family